MARIPGKHFFLNLFRRRTLLYQMIRRDFERRFVGSAAGWLWGVIHPLVLLFSWAFVFQTCLKMEVPPGQGTDNYTIFLFCGYLPWMLFSDTVQRSSTSMLENANLITKTLFPSEFIPVAIFISSLLNHLIALALTIFAVAWMYGQVSLALLWLPLWIFLTGLFAVGVSWVASSLQVYLRDTAQVITVVLTLWFWITPIFMTIDQIPQHLRFLPALNPLSFVVSAYRSHLLTLRAPDWSSFLLLTAFAGGIFVIGGLVFRQLKRGFADVL